MILWTDAFIVWDTAQGQIVQDSGGERRAGIMEQDNRRGRHVDENENENENENGNENGNK